jgi:hypothetical protein
MKYTLVALIFSLLVSSLSVNLLYVDMLNKINEIDSTNDHKMGIIIKQVHELRDKAE